MMREWDYSYGFHMGSIGMLVLSFLIVWPFWRICRQAIPGHRALGVHSGRQSDLLVLVRVCGLAERAEGNVRLSKD